MTTHMIFRRSRSRSNESYRSTSWIKLCDDGVRALTAPEFQAARIKVSVASLNPKKKGWQKMIKSYCSCKRVKTQTYISLSMMQGYALRELGICDGDSFWLKIEKA